MSTPLNTVQAAKELGVSERTLRRWRAQDAGPNFTDFFGIVRYPQEELERFKEFHLRRTHVGLPGRSRGVLALQLPVDRRAIYNASMRLGRKRTMSDRREEDNS